MLKNIFNKNVSYSDYSACRSLHNICIGTPYLVLYRRRTVDVIVRKSRLAKLSSKGSVMSKRFVIGDIAESYGIGVCIGKKSSFLTSSIRLRARFLNEDLDSTFLIFSPSIRFIRSFKIPEYNKYRSKCYFLKASGIK